MRKTLIAAAMLATFGVTQAQTTEVIGGTTNAGIINWGISNVGPAGPHKPDYPGISVVPGEIIDLDGISMSFLQKGTVAGYNRYYLPGYTHTDPNGGIITTNINWARVPTVGEDVFFGLASTGSTNTHAAFYVGDRTSYAVPVSNTSYSVGGLLATPGTNAATPVVLTGTLNLAVSGANASLSGSLGSLEINPSVANNVNIANGTFDGISTYGGSTGTTSGHFYGSGVGAGNSAVAGIASGTGYVASFGGKN